MVDLLAAQIALVVEAGKSESTDPARDAQTLFVLVLEGVHDVGLGHVDPLEQAEYLWRFAAAGLAINP